eukprot:1391870-Amphidinium_carterae.1
MKTLQKWLSLARTAGTSRQEVGSPNSGNQAVAEEARQGKGKDAAETHEEQLEQVAHGQR